MAVIKISLDEVQQGAALFHNKSSEISEDVTLLQNAVNEFAGVWEGKAFEAFSNEFTSLRKGIDDFVKLIDDIGTQLDSIREAMIAADEDIARQLGM